MKGDMFGPDESLEPEVVEVAQEPIEALAEQPVEAPVAEIPPGTVTIPAPKAEPVMVPLAALHEVRDEVKRLKAEAEERNRQQQVQQPEPIDPWSDLDGALSQRDQQMQQMLYQQKLQMSRRFAEMQHGKEEVEAAVQWAYSLCESDKAFNQQVLTSDDPVGFALQQYQRDQIASTVTMDDFKAFQAWKQAQGNPQPQAAQILALDVPSPVQPPPRSLVSAQSAGAPTPPKSDPVEEKLAKMF